MKLELTKKYIWIESNPDILGGKPIIKGTRLAVAQVLRCLSHGMTLTDIRDTYGDFPEGAIEDALAFASHVVEQDDFHVAS